MNYVRERPTLGLAVLSTGGPRLRRLLGWAIQTGCFDAYYIGVDSRYRIATVIDSIADLLDIDDAEYKFHSIEVKTIDQALSNLHSRVETDWCLHLGDDEVMGDNFTYDRVGALLMSSFDGYSTPRYNIVSATGCQTYMHDEHRYPDMCQRLFRRDHIEHGGELHEGAMIKGRVGIAPMHVFHLDFVDLTRPEREARWQRYVKQGVNQIEERRGLVKDYYARWSLFEDYPYEERECVEKCTYLSRV